MDPTTEHNRKSLDPLVGLAAVVLGLLVSAVGHFASWFWTVHGYGRLAPVCEERDCRSAHEDAHCSTILSASERTRSRRRLGERTVAWEPYCSTQRVTSGQSTDSELHVDAPVLLLRGLLAGVPLPLQDVGRLIGVEGDLNAHGLPVVNDSEAFVDVCVGIKAVGNVKALTGDRAFPDAGQQEAADGAPGVAMTHQVPVALMVVEMPGINKPVGLLPAMLSVVEESHAPVLPERLGQTGEHLRVHFSHRRGDKAQSMGEGLHVNTDLLREGGTQLGECRPQVALQRCAAVLLQYFLRNAEGEQLSFSQGDGRERERGVREAVTAAFSVLLDRGVHLVAKKHDVPARRAFGNLELIHEFLESRPAVTPQPLLQPRHTTYRGT